MFNKVYGEFMKKRRFFTTFISILAGVLALSGCQNIDNPDAASTQIKRDLTVTLPTAYDISANFDFQDVPSQFDYLISDEISEISDFASVSVKGVVQEVIFTGYNGDAFTAVSLAVEECYKGDLQQGDLITILYNGGYIPLKDHIDRYNDKYMFENLSDEEIANTMLHEIPEDYSEPQVGEHNIYFLNSPYPDSGLPIEAYQITRGMSSILKLESDGETVSRKKSIMDSEIEILSLHDVIDIASRNNNNQDISGE